MPDEIQPRRGRGDVTSTSQIESPDGVALAADQSADRASGAVDLPSVPRWAPPLRVCALLGLDALGLTLAALAGFALWASPVHGQPLSLYAQLWPLLPILLAGFAQVRLYPGFGLGFVETLRRYWLVTCFGFVALAAVTFGLKVPHQYSRMTFGIAWVASLLLLPPLRYLWLTVAHRWRWWPEPVVVIGSGERARTAIEALRDRPRIGYRPVAVLDTRTHPSGVVHGVPVLGTLEQAPALAQAGVRTAVVEPEGLSGNGGLAELRRRFRRVMTIRSFDDMPVDGVQIRNLGGVLGVEYNNNLLQRGNQVVKRVSDILLGSLVAVLATPVILVAGLLVRLVSPGPVLYWQKRVGRYGQPLDLPKVRTMVMDAGQRLEELLDQDPELRREWDRGFKLKVDPRVVRFVGQPIRRWSVDELPQLWLVVTGRMSLVGPRPLPEYHANRLTPAGRQLRESVRPGVTGLWQVNTRSEASIQELEAHDTYYIRNWSVWLDLYVLLKTLYVVIVGRGAY